MRKFLLFCVSMLFFGVAFALPAPVQIKPIEVVYAAEKPTDMAKQQYLYEATFIQPYIDALFLATAIEVNAGKLTGCKISQREGRVVFACPNKPDVVLHGENFIMARKSLALLQNTAVWTHLLAAHAKLVEVVKSSSHDSISQLGTLKAGRKYSFEAGPDFDATTVDAEITKAFQVLVDVHVEGLFLFAKQVGLFN